MSTANKRISLGVVLSAISLIVGWQTSGCKTYAAFAQRLSVVETKEDAHTREYNELRQDVREVRDDVKRLLERQ
jgi:hypothetical protein